MKRDRFHPAAIAILLLACLMVSACHTSHIVVGKTRPPTNPDDVRLYLTPPPKYEEIAIVDANSEGTFTFSRQKKMNTAVGRLKEEAAKLGANGIIITGNASADTVSVGSGFGQATGTTLIGTGVSVSGDGLNRKLSGVAIWVTEP